MIKCCHCRRPGPPLAGDRRGLGLASGKDETQRLGPSRSLISVEKGAAIDMYQNGNNNSNIEGRGGVAAGF